MTDEIKKVDENPTPTTPPAKKSFFQNSKGAKEWLRKQIVSLKRRPNKIPMFWIVLCMIIYTVCITPISYTSINAGVKNGGLIAFWVTLFSILVCVMYMNAYPKRAKVKLPMLVMTYIFLTALFVLDIMYFINMNERLSSGVYDDSIYYSYFVQAKAVITVHIIFLAIALALCATLPLYTKLLKKIDTSITIEESDLHTEIKLEEDVTA